MSLVAEGGRRRKGDLHQSTVVNLAGDIESRPIGFGESLGEREAEAASARVPGRAGRALAKGFERGFNILEAHADAGVAHPQHDLARVGECSRYDHLAARTGELD